MRRSSSVDRIDAEDITATVIPTLTVALVCVLILYPLLVLAANGVVWPLPDGLLGCGAAALAAHVTLARYPKLTQAFIGWGIVAGVPLALTLMAMSVGAASLAMHGALLFMLGAMGWALSAAVVDEFCIRSAVQKVSGGSLATLLVVAAMELAMVEAALPGMSSAAQWLHPFVVGVLVLAGVGVLAALGRLVAQLREVPGGVQVVRGFSSMWLRGALLVLAACAGIALLLPKQIITEPLRPLRESVREELGDRQSSIPQESLAGQMLYQGRNRTQPGREGERQGAGQKQGAGAAPRPQRSEGERRLREAIGKVLDAIQSAATAFEPGQSKTGPPTPGPGSSGRGESEQTSAGSTPPQPEDPLDRRTERLRETLTENPLRVLKLILIAATAMAVLYVLLRYVRPWLMRVGGAWWRRLVARCAAMLAPWRERRVAQRREAAIGREIASMRDPFADPFEGDLPAEDLAESAYGSFIAYVWVWGQEKDPQQTAFDFARQVADGTTLDRDAVWTIARASVQNAYSPDRLSPHDLDRLHDAWGRIARQVEGTLTPERLAAKRAAYVRQMAEDRVDAAQVDSRNRTKKGSAQPEEHEDA